MPCLGLAAGEGSGEGQTGPGWPFGLVAPPLKGLQGLWGQRPGLTCHVAESGRLRTETWTLPKRSTTPVLFVCIRAFFFKTSSAYIIIRCKLFILVLFLIELKKSI